MSGKGSWRRACAGAVSGLLDSIHIQNQGKVGFQPQRASRLAVSVYEYMVAAVQTARVRARAHVWMYEYFMRHLRISLDVSRSSGLECASME